MTATYTGSGLRRLDFDIEARPLEYGSGDFTFKEVTAVAAQFIGERTMHCWTLGVHTTQEMLEGFTRLYDEAELVIGHWIRGYDLGTVNAGLLEFGLKSLSAKRTHDTKNDLIKFSGISKSQESIAAMLGVAAPKIQMTHPMWRSANRLSPEGIKLTAERCRGDVRQNIEMHAALLDRGMLCPPKMWYPDGSSSSRGYQP